MQKRVCLTGATGHVGYAILKELQNHPDKETRILIRRDSDIFDGLVCEKVKGDITDYDSLVKAFDGCEIVYHVAGCVEIKPGNEDFVYKVNVTGTENVIRACKECGVKKLVYMGSVDTYVPLPDNEVMHEVYTYDPDTLEGAYAKTKAEATAKVLAANGDGFETVVCQPSACMGPYDFKVSSVGSMIRMFSKGAFPITMTFGGYNFVDVRDVAFGTVAAGDKAKGGSVYILCNKSVTVDEFIRMLADASGNASPKVKIGKGVVNFAAPLMETYYKVANKPAIFTRYAIRKLCSNCNFSYEKAEKELGYHPRPLETSLKETLAWIRESEEAEAQKQAQKATEAAEAAQQAAEEAERRAEEMEKAVEQAQQAAEQAALDAQQAAAAAQKASRKAVKKHKKTLKQAEKAAEAEAEEE